MKTATPVRSNGPVKTTDDSITLLPSDERPDPRAPKVPTMQVALLPARVFLALGWVRAGVEKVIEPTWWSGQYLRLFLAEQQDAMLPFVQPITRLIGMGAIPTVVAAFVLVAELVLGVCLFTGRKLLPALGVACALNLSFVALGVVTPSAFYLVLQLTVLFAVLANRSKPKVQRSVIIVAVSVAVALAMVPYVRTLHPGEVIDDPAIMIATIAVLVAGTQTIIAVEAR